MIFVCPESKYPTLCTYVHVQSCLTLCDPMDCSPPGSSAHGILQAGILEWVAMPSSKGSSRPRDPIHVSQVHCLGRQVLYYWATWETWTPQIFFIPLVFYLLRSLSSKRCKERGFSTPRWNFSDSGVLNMVENIFKNQKQWWKTRKHPLSLNSLKTCFEVRKADMNWFEIENLSARLKTVKKAADMCCDERRCMWRQEESRNAGRWLNTAGKGRPGGLSPAQTPGTCLGQAAKGTIWMVLKLGSKHWTESCMFSGTQDGGVKGRLPRGCSQWHQSPRHPFRKAGTTGPSRASPIPEESTTRNSRVFHIQRWEWNSKLPWQMES